MVAKTRHVTRGVEPDRGWLSRCLEPVGKLKFKFAHSDVPQSDDVPLFFGVHAFHLRTQCERHKNKS